MFRRVLIVGYTLLALLTLPLGLSAVAPVDLAVSVNQLRYERGLPYLAGDASLDVYAQAHAEWMAATGRLEHSNIGSLLGPWSVVGENVGMGTSVYSLIMAFHTSPTHADNLYGEWTHLGAGLAIDGSGRLWVAIVVAS